MNTTYVCRECGEEFKNVSVQAVMSNINTVQELVYNMDPCDCWNDNDMCDQIYDLEQENAKLKAQQSNTRLQMQRTIGSLESENMKLKAQILNANEGLHRLLPSLRNSGNS